MHFLALSACALALALAALPAAAAEPIGLVKSLSGTATVTRNGASLPLAAGADVFAEDTVQTGSNGSLGLTFRDDTTLSMGPRSRLALGEFVFEPAANAMKMGLDLQNGTFALISGQIAKLAPEAISIKTPVMNISIRGTSFLIEVDGND